MSEYGVKIKNYEAASVYEYMYGFRNNLDSTDAMLTNSLFKDYLDEIGMNVWKGESTRDIICLQFGYKTKCYSSAKAKAEKALENATTEFAQNNIRQVLSCIENNKDKCVEISKNDLRTKFYKEGCSILYKTYNRNGNVVSEENIHYKMLYRTPGKAKKGTVMFIRDELYDQAHEFLYMGYELPMENSPIVEVGAYASLITSSIVGKVQILPEQLLIVKDVDTFINTNVVQVYTDENKHCKVRDVPDYKLVSTIFDGQALIDSSIFPEWADGYVLLRHHMTKCAAFSANIQQFMMDYYGDEYETATVKDMFGNDVAVKNIRLITTDNAIKWLKFKTITYDDWLEWIGKNNYMFGIVKTSHASKLGDVQRMSYQMINSLDIDTMPQVVEKSVDYIQRLKSDDDAFVEYLEKNANFSNDYDVLVALVKHNPDFVRSEYFRKRKEYIIRAYVLNFKSGRCIQNADNLTIVGSPYAMLLHSVGADIYGDDSFSTEDDCIQCWTNRFEDGEYLAEFRNPFNSRNNLGLLHNKRSDKIDKYINLGRLCVAVNMINTDFQARNNGSDQDSDSIYTTNQPQIVEHARNCYKNYATIVNDIKPEKNVYNYSMDSYAAIDNNLTSAQLAIGQSSNMAQLCLTYTYNYDDKKYADNVCILAVLA